MSTVASTRKRRDGCPLCGRPAAAEHSPFCSQGCKSRDLLNWLGDAYRVPGPPADEKALEESSDRG